MTEDASESTAREANAPPQWPPEVDIGAMYQAERAATDATIRNALDLSVWSLESKKDATAIYLHCKNNESLAYSVKAVARVTGTVVNVMECLRSFDASTYRQFARRLHAKCFVDCEVLHAHQIAGGERSESLALKWAAYASGKTTLATGKEFCVREYCTILRDHPQYGTIGVCKFASYDGQGAKYSIRAKPDTYSLSVFEPSSFVVAQTQEEGILQVTLTFSMRKARGRESVSGGIKALSMRFAQDLSNLQRAVQHALFQPTTLAEKHTWVDDNQRSNCSLCVQSFSMLRRKHHCRVCGEIVCSSCTLFKTVNNADSDVARIRVCKACIGKSCTTDITSLPSSHATLTSQSSSIDSVSIARSSTRSIGVQSPRKRGIGSAAAMPNFKQPTLSVVSTSSGTSSSSDESRRSGGDDVESVGSMPYFQMQRSMSALYLKKPSFSDSDTKSVGSNSPRSTQSSQHSFQSSSVNGGGGSSSSTSRSHKNERRTSYFNDDFADICQLAMETMNCVMAGIRTDDVEVVNYFDGQQHSDLPRSLPTFRRIASRGKPCIVLDVSADQRIAGDRRMAAKLQFFVGIPLIMDGEVIGDLCVADRYPRQSIDSKTVEVLMVLGKTVTRYMALPEFQEDLARFKASRRSKRELETASSMGMSMGPNSTSTSTGGMPPLPQRKEVTF